MGELEDSLGNISNAIQQFLVIFLSKVSPRKLTIKALRSYSQQVISPRIHINAGLLALITENTHSVALGKFPAFIPKVLSDRELFWSDPGLSSGCESGGVDDAVEENIVLTHKLPQLDRFGRGRHPPLPISLGENLCSHGDIAYGSFKPHIKDLLLVSGMRHGDTPLQISCDTSVFSRRVQPAASDSLRIIAPSLHAAFVQQPLLQCSTLRCQFEVEMGGLSGRRGVSAD